jgi:hypothetical protein
MIRVEKDLPQFGVLSAYGLPMHRTTTLVEQEVVSEKQILDYLLQTITYVAITFSAIDKKEVEGPRPKKRLILDLNIGEIVQASTCDF